MTRWRIANQPAAGIHSILSGGELDEELRGMRNFSHSLSLVMCLKCVLSSIVVRPLTRTNHAETRETLTHSLRCQQSRIDDGRLASSPSAVRRIVHYRYARRSLFFFFFSFNTHGTGAGLFETMESNQKK